jgi:hypothetical protein
MCGFNLVEFGAAYDASMKGPARFHACVISPNFLIKE